jgi:RNA polymerase sigma factor (sigma-70 family)
MQQAANMSPDVGADFAALLEGNRRLIFKVAHTYGRGPADVEDLAQEIAAQSWRAFRTYDPARSFSTWLYRIALNVAISWLRVEAPRRQASVSFEEGLHDAAVSEVFDADDGVHILRGFIASQPRLDRALLFLYLEERPYTEIAEILGITPTNVTTKINRLKQRLRDYAENRHGTR